MKVIVSLLLLLSALPSIAQPMIAVVKMDDIFANYYRKQELEKDVQQRIEALKSSARVVAVQEMDTKLKALAETVRNKTLPAQTRELAAKEFNSLAIEHQALILEKEEFLTGEKQKAKQELVATLEKLIAHVRETISEISKKEGYDLVLETGGKTSSQISPIIYLRHKTDITSLVLESLNKNAPEKPEEQKTE